MPRTPKRAQATPLDKSDARFEGSAYSNQELLFLLDHLGEPTAIALADVDELPTGVNPDQVEPILERVFELETYQQHLRDKSGVPDLQVWVGIDALKNICHATLEWNQHVAELKRRTKGASPEVRRAASAPSLFLWDPSTDIATFGGVGSDADKVLTALNEAGQRVELFTELKEMGTGAIRSLAGVAKFVKAKSQAEMSNRMMEGPDDLIYDEGEIHARVECPLCGMAEPYEVQKTSTKRNAVAKVMRHLQVENNSKVDAHRLLYNRLKSGKAGARHTRVQAPSREQVGA